MVTEAISDGFNAVWICTNGYAYKWISSYYKYKFIALANLVQ
jgi:hypothetical protein